MTKHRRLILHIGMPKAGSTAIQSALRAASQAGLLKQVVYPVLSQKATPDAVESGEAARLYTAAIHEDFRKGDHSRLEAAVDTLVKDLPADDRPVLFSSETLWVLPEAAMTKIFDAFRARGFAPEVVAVVRRVDEWWFSAMSQNARSGTLHKMAAEGNARGLLRCAQSLLRPDVPATVLPFSRTDLVGDFFSFLGEDPAIAAAQFDRSINPKLTASAAAILKRVQGVFREKNHMVRFSNALSQAVADLPDQDVRLDEMLAQLPDGGQPPASMSVRVLAETLRSEFDAAPAHPNLQKLRQYLAIDAADLEEVSYRNTPALLSLNEEVRLNLAESEILSALLLSQVEEDQQQIAKLEQQLAEVQKRNKEMNARNTKLVQRLADSQ